jgi:site-specific DNA-methyltransferase (adenine-specific)
VASRTRSFGSSNREAHDSSGYYERRLAQAQISDDTTINPPKLFDQFFGHTSEQMPELADNSVALMVTSPPYNVGKDYDDDLSLDEYLELLSRVFAETYRVLEPGGRACMNIANVGRKPYVPLASHVNMLMNDLGYLMRGEILWVKGKGATGSCAWGSWQSAKNPVLRDLHEYVLVYSKGRFDRVKEGKSTIGRDEFMRNTLSVWEFPPESATKIGHPAPFPEELPRRLIELYTYEDDLVLDPFCGAGTTCVAAEKLGRKWVGYDINEEYLKIARRRMEDATPSLWAGRKT